MKSDTGDAGKPAGKPSGIRRHMIVERLLAGGYVGVAELAREFDVTEVTIRSDLDIIGTKHAVHRVRGGAVYRHHHPTETSYESSLRTLEVEKRVIGRAAARLVQTGDTVILDVGTTTMGVANAMCERQDLTDVVVITNSLPIAMTMEKVVPRYHVIVTGGSLRPQMHSLVAPYATELLRLFHADVAFIGCSGVDAERGITNLNLPETEMKRALIASAKRAVVVADHSKLGVVDRGHVAHLGDVWGLVTDDGDGDRARELAAAGLKILVPGVKERALGSR